MRVGGRLTNSSHSYHTIHPVILHADNHVTKVLIRSEYIRLLHAGPTLNRTSISLRFRVIGLKRIVRSTIRSCIACKHHIQGTSCQLKCQLPPERVNPGSVLKRLVWITLVPSTSNMDMSGSQSLHLFICVAIGESCAS